MNKKKFQNTVVTKEVPSEKGIEALEQRYKRPRVNMDSGSLSYRLLGGFQTLSAADCDEDMTGGVGAAGAV